MRAAMAMVVAAATAAIAAAQPRWETCPTPRPVPIATSRGHVAVGGASIYYASFGDAEDPPVVLLHGGLGVSDHWSNQIPALLEANFNPIAIDSRGHGRSTRTRAEPTYAEMARDVAAVMDELKLTQAAIVGWSDGGQIALKLAIGHPERVAKLIVFGANVHPSGRRPGSSQGSATFRAYTAKCRAAYQRLSSTPNQFDSLVAWMLPVWRSPSGITVDQLRAISAPTLILGADRDELIVKHHFEVMAALIPRGSVFIIDDASHFAPWQAPIEFNAAIVEFLRR
jgi:pimeloyl-ACP methyl ester carboxylesterase